MFLRIETYPRRKSNKHTNKILRGFEWGGWVFCGVYLFVFFFCFFLNLLIVFNKDTLHVSIYSNGYKKHESK